ncbi:MAG: TetR family transcriptional regulator [Nakamurella sp.]
MARSSERDARTRLIDATTELMWERGYAATSPRAIMDRAEVGQGSLYHHFTGKEALAAAAFERRAAETFAAAEALLSADRPAPQRIRDYLLRQRDVLRGCPVGRMAQDADVLTSAPLQEILRTTFSRLRGLMRAVVAEGVRTGDFPADLDPQELADTVLAVVQGGYVLARAQGSAVPFRRAVTGAVALIDHATTPTTGSSS